MDKTYIHQGSSFQHIVGGGAKQDRDSLWLIKPPHDQRQLDWTDHPVRYGDSVRLEHIETRRNLHSHDQLAPLTGPVQGQHEVTAYAGAAPGEGNSQDNWYVFPENGKEWRTENPFRLRHVHSAGRFLHSHGQADQQRTGGLFEVTAVDRGDSNDLFECLIEESPADARGRKVTATAQAEALSVLRQLCDRFETFARQMNVRHAKRAGLFPIDDEYDVQDVFHALLRLHFADVRSEEVTPSVAGKSGRMDFLLQGLRIAVETKMTRERLGPAELITELGEDRIRFKRHPELQHLFCFVHDPKRFCPNPVAVETDLSDSTGHPIVHVVVRPH